MINAPHVVIGATRFEGNVGEDDGGALLTETNSTLFEDVKVFNNTVFANNWSRFRSGGAWRHFDGSCDVSDVIFVNNSAGDVRVPSLTVGTEDDAADGGAVQISSTALVMQRVSFLDNKGSGQVR